MSMEGEALLGRTFPKARLAAPSIIFFDEADAIAPKRGQGGNSGSTISERLVSTLLTEMDGLEQNRLRESLYWLPKIFLRQLMLHFCMRPGRFDLVLHVPPPDEDKRVCLEILWIHSRNMKFGRKIDVDVGRIAKCTDIFTGADEGLCMEAGMVTLRESTHESVSVSVSDHFQATRDSLNIYRMKSTPLQSPAADMTVRNFWIMSVF